MIEKQLSEEQQLELQTAYKAVQDTKKAAIIAKASYQLARTAYRDLLKRITRQTGYSEFAIREYSRIDEPRTKRKRLTLVQKYMQDRIRNRKHYIKRREQLGIAKPYRPTIMLDES